MPIDPTQPVTNSSLASAPIRSNFAAAALTENGLLSKWNGSSAPVIPALMQDWVNTTVIPYIWYVWDGAAWVEIGTINPTTHAFSAISSPSVSYATPTSAATLTAPAGSGGYVLDPTGTLASLVVTAPPSPLDQQIFELTSTQTISNLTVNPASGQSLDGGAVNLLANGGVAWRYLAVKSTWYRRY